MTISTIWNSPIRCSLTLLISEPKQQQEQHKTGLASNTDDKAIVMIKANQQQLGKQYSRGVRSKI
jgi:hypothetical protein